MGRAPCCEKNGLKKGPWTPEEDQKLIDYIQNHGHGSWRTIPKNAGLQRCGKSCRLRWTNYLRPDIKRGRFSFEEEETIIQLHSVLGNKWSAIAARLPGRTDNEIKNYWNTHIRKRLLRMGIDPVTHTPRLDLLDISSILSSPQMNLSRLLGMQQPLVTPDLIRLATSLLSSQQQNQNSLIQNLAQFQHQNLYQSLQLNQEMNPAACTTSAFPPCDVDTYLYGLNLAQPNNNVPHFQQNLCNTTGDINQVPNLWQDNAAVASKDFDPVPTYTTLPENPTNFQLNNICNQNFDYSSFLSTPSSSPTPLNSCSTYITTEDERDSYCSDVLKFEVPDIFDIYDL